MKVWDVITEHPETYEIFRRHGCPDMRTGLYAMSAHLMNVGWAARMHKIPVDALLTELNEVVERTEKEKSLH